MNTTELREAYEAFAVEASAGGFGPPPPGEWDAAQVVAHVTRNDELLAAATESIMDGRPAPFDNRAALEGLATGEVRVDDVRASGERLCALLDRLTEEQAATVVPVFIQDGTEIAVDQPMPWGVLLGFQSSYHLPEHGEQLKALRPA
jgi:DinB superfamily